jgi:4-aminobutyrate aminotransferase-like enzyme
MAAEMSTGLLAMLHTYERRPAVSMLVTGLEATYHKKATCITCFVCSGGAAVEAAIQDAVHSGEARTLRMHSEGRNISGELVAEFYITWSFKVKSAGPSS